MNKTFIKPGISLFVIILIMHSNLTGQIQRLHYIDDFTVLDTAQYEITYEVKKIDEPQKPKEKTTDIQKLLIGAKISKTYSYLLYQNDSLCTLLEKKGRNFPAAPKAASLYHVYKDYSANELTVTYRSDGEVFRYKEPFPDFQWVMTNEKKTIMTYPCQKATLDFRGRAYEAWFSPMLPFSEGPFKFSGLPGLILEIQDSEKHYIFKCIGIKKPDKPIAIRIRKWDYTETTREKLHAFLKKKYSNLTEYYNARGITFGTKVNGKVVINPKNYSIPYNPIELE
ncbi:MAG: GLPGLI family protein [Bacteroidales bacterium]|nr:GLPGLI family protein [Bacteroidales bacterium]MCF8332946.1 GLPGLI family protein [Bacteroidales bacterium]